MRELSHVISDIQRNKIKPEDQSTICKAVQDYYKEMNARGLYKASLLDYEPKDISVPKSLLEKATKEELMSFNSGLNEEMTKAEMIKTIEEIK